MMLKICKNCYCALQNLLIIIKAVQSYEILLILGRFKKDKESSEKNYKG